MRILQISGVVILLIFTLRLFGIFSSYITLDIQWMSLLFIGLFVSCLGFYLEAKSIVPQSSFQARNRKLQMNSMRNALLLTSIILIFILSTLIKF